MIVHGTNDKDILPVAAKNLHKWNRNSKLVLLNNMNHEPGYVQPWLSKEVPEDLKKSSQRINTIYLKKIILKHQ